MALNLSDKLFDILSHSIDWVKYAESKNAALIVFNTLILIRLLFQLDTYQSTEKLLLMLSILLFFTSTIICCISFIPVINYKSLNTTKTIHNPKEKIYDLLLKQDDLIYTPKQWLTLYCKQHEIDTAHIKKIDLIYAEQILIQKKIRFRKYKLFNISLYCLLFSLFLLLSAASIHYF